MIYIGVNDKAKKVKAAYIGGPDGKARKISKIYTSPNGVAKLCWFKPVEETFTFSGVEKIYTIPESGVYSIEAIGAGGSKGNTYSGDYGAIPGKGGKITGTFRLAAGDILHLVVGGAGTCTKGTAKDGSSGAGGGGTFVFREISTITDSKYQFAKSGKNYEILLVAPGGGGTNDESYQGSATHGKDGLAADYKSLNNYVAWSTENGSPTATSTSKSTTMGITQYINYDAGGTVYVRGGSTCTGGYGCGGSSDDAATAGGGWSGSNTTGSYGWSLDTNAVGVDGVETGNGSAHIKRIGV